jgi:non-specific serine/threonine protein kinase
VAPASLLTNWVAEIERFAPDIKTITAHPSAMKSEEMDTLDAERLTNVDLVITSYGTLTRVPALVQIPWKLAILDEAQAIKNPGTRQSRVVKQLQSKARIALTGTPVENRLGISGRSSTFLIPACWARQRISPGLQKDLANINIIPTGRSGISFDPTFCDDSKPTGP